MPRMLLGSRASGPIPLCGWRVANTTAVAAVFRRSLSTAVDRPTARIACEIFIPVSLRSFFFFVQNIPLVGAATVFYA